MRPSEAPPAEPLIFEGEPFARGVAQARCRPDLVGAVRAAVDLRLAEIAGALERAEIRTFLDAQKAATRELAPELWDEIEGIGEGFGIAPERLFAWLHAATITDLLETAKGAPEGCTALAVASAEGALLAKNRDYRDEHRALQQVMLHRPARGPAFLVVGSLGAPGCFSSGLNAEGLAIADTATRTRDLGPGLHRYFLLTLLLARCATVAEALAVIRTTPHTGGGCLVLADAEGAVAAVELGHARLGIETGTGGRVGRTNHHRQAETASADLEAARAGETYRNSLARAAALEEVGRRLPAAPGADDLATLLARHADDDGPAFCRHGGTDLAHTISGASWDTVAKRLFFCAGQPCTGAWHAFTLQPHASGSPAP